MKKLICVLVCGLILVPLSAWGQKWIEPYTGKDGNQVEGHWQIPEDVRQQQYSTPGKINPYTGQFNPYNSSGKGPQSVTPVTPPPANSIPMKGNFYYTIPDYRYQGR